jgi:hypothetical protein
VLLCCFDATHPSIDWCGLVAAKCQL